MVVDSASATLPPAQAQGGRHVVGFVSAVWAVAVAAVATSAVLLVPVRASERAGVGPLRPGDVADLVVAVVLVSIGAVVVVRGRSVRYGWLVLWSGATLGVVEAAEEGALYGIYVANQPASPLVGAAVWLQDQWMLFYAPAALLLPALFPTGEAVWRWRRPVQAAAVAWAGLVVLHAIVERPAGNVFEDRVDAPANPTGFLPVAMEVVDGLWLALTLASLAIAVGSLRTRWRTADRDERQQLKWVLFALTIAAGVLVGAVVDTFLVEVLGIDARIGWLESTLLPVSWVGVAVALGLGILRYRLYDVDLIINRTVVYATMSAIVVTAYAAVVVGAAALVPGLDGSATALVATALVAVAFAPVRSRVQDGIDRMVFGRRGDPYGVLTDLGGALARSGAPDVMLHTVAETVAAALKLPGVAIELAINGGWETRTTTGNVAGASAGTEVVALRYQGEVVGRMVAARRSPTEPLHPDDLRLLENVAHHAAALAHTVRLTLALRRSREALVLAREEERRRLRRDLHDGLGPALASQTFRLDAALELLGTRPDTAAEQLRVLKAQNQELVADIRRLVYELRPPALDQLGLAGALAAHAGQLARSGRPALEVGTDPDPLPEIPAAVEVAAYRIGSEAITNVVRHAGASTCTVALAAGDGALTVRVADNGVGVGRVGRSGVGRSGVGMTSMRERAAELGGTVVVANGRPTGTVVTATLPLAPGTARHLRTGADLDDPAPSSWGGHDAGTH